MEPQLESDYWQHQEHPLQSTCYRLIFSSLQKHVTCTWAFFAAGTYICCWKAEKKQQNSRQIFFVPHPTHTHTHTASQSLSSECVCVSYSQTASKYMRSALGLCLALARLGQPHSKFPEGGNREKNDSMQINHSQQIKRQISGRDKRCWLAENNGDGGGGADVGIRGVGLWDLRLATNQTR